MAPTGSHPLFPVQFDHVWKRYRLGSKEDSLRDTIPAFLKRLTGRNGHARDDGAGEFWALQDVTFHVKKAETLGMIGPNGAGKSTALKLLSRICQQTKGSIHVRGRLAALIEIGAGFHPDLTGRENVYMNGTIMGMRHKEIDRLFDSIVAFSEIEQFLDMPVKRYSSGMSVRLGFAVAAHVNPEILLIDEVLSVGDLAFQQKCYQRILDLKANGTTIIFISHNLEAVQRICDRVVLLHEGHGVVDGAPMEAIAQYRQMASRKQRFVKMQRSGEYELADTAKDIEFIGARLLNGDQEAQETLQTGDVVRVQLDYLAKRPIRSPSVTVTVERIDGLVCHEASTQLSSLSWDQWEGPGRLTLEYPALNLTPNTYLVHASIYESQNPVPLAHLTEPLDLHITSDRPNRGVVHLSHEWHSEAP